MIDLEDIYSNPKEIRESYKNVVKEIKDKNATEKELFEIFFLNILPFKGIFPSINKPKNQPTHSSTSHKLSSPISSTQSHPLHYIF